MKKRLLLAVPLMTSAVMASDYYVATNGVDILPGGTEAAPFATIQYGVNQLTAGDTLYVRGGRYEEKVTIDGLIGTGGGSVWSGGTGWSGAWELGPDTTTAVSDGNTAAYMVRTGSMTRTLASGVSGGTLSFSWDADSLDSGGGGDEAFAEIFDGTWHTVWQIDHTHNGGDVNSGIPDGLVPVNVSLAAYGTVTQVRFRIEANGGGDHFFVDDVVIGSASHDFEPAAGEGITIRNYGDETVVIDGTTAVPNSWEAVSNGIYKTSFTTDIWQLFVDDEMQTSARWPDAEAWTDAMWDKDTTWIQQDAASTDGTFIDEAGGPELAASGNDFTGAIAIMNTGSWLSFARVVTNHSAGSGSFNYAPIGNQYHHKIINGAAFFEASYACLSTNKEWFYNADADELFLIPDNGLNPDGRNIRGKVLTYGLEVSNSQSLTLKGIDFFACTLKIANSGSIVVQDSDVLYPSYSKRMLGSTANAEATYIEGDGNILLNCTFQFADGAGIEFVGDGGRIENCLFHQIDYSCVGTLHDVMVNIRNASNLTFRQNTLDTGGNSVGIKGGDSSIFELNRVTNQGMLQHDGSAIQTDADYTDGTIMQNNWVHDHIKFALRFDSPWLDPDVYGTNGVMRYNVLWNTEPMVPKGDYHHIYNNTGFDNDVVDIAIFSDTVHGGINSNTVTRNNAVNLISGSRSSAEPYPGVSDHNWSGSEIKNELVDAAQWDFRPAVGSALIDAGTNVPAQVNGFVGTAPDMGAYEFGSTNYWIPGYIPAQASMPIPNQGVLNQPEGRDLIFQPGYQADQVKVYFGTNAASPALLGTFSAKHNVIDPRDHGVSPQGNTVYYWRVDTVLSNSSVFAGEVWSYTTADYTPTIPDIVFSDDFEAYTAGDAPATSNWASLITLGDGSILVTDMEGDQVVRLNNASTTADRTVMSAVDVFPEQDLITLSFDSYHDGGTPMAGPMSLSVGIDAISSHLNQARKVSLASYISTNTWHHFDWVVNQSGAAVNYVIDGVTHSVAAGSADLWRDGQLVVDNGTDKPGNGNELTDVTKLDSFGWTVNKADAADWRIDDVEVRNYAYAQTPSLSPLESWMDEYGLTDPMDDPDGDGLNTLNEFALGGNPTNASDIGYVPVLNNGSDPMYFIYPRRLNSGLIYWIETSTNLTSNAWTNGGYTELPVTGTLDPEFESVTNEIPIILPQTFVRLMIEQVE